MGRSAGILSTQVLQEFYVNATRKIRTPLPKPEARSVVEHVRDVVRRRHHARADVAAAFQIEDSARIGFWDALIVAVATSSGARRMCQRT